MPGKTSAMLEGLAMLDRFGRPARQVARWAAAALVGVFCGAAAVVAWRSAAGALAEPLPPGVLAAVGVLTVVTTAGLRVFWRQVVRSEGRRNLDLPVAVVLTAAVAILGAALSLPGPSAAGWIPFWMLLLGVEAWAWRPGAWRRPEPVPHDAPAPSRRVDPPQVPAPHVSPDVPLDVDVPPDVDVPVAEAEPSARDPLEDAAPDENVTQQLTRSCTADGAEQLAGWLRMPLAAGQRSGSVHLAFCPPFDRTPELSVDQLDGPRARVKTAQLLPHGARLDLKLSAAAADAPDSVLLQFTARSRRDRSQQSD